MKTISDIKASIDKDVAFSDFGLVRYHRKAGRWLAKHLVATSLTPNQVTVMSFATVLVASLCFSLGTFSTGIVGALLFQLALVLDCTDGCLARARQQTSTYGHWLDVMVGHMADALVFFSICWGLSSQRPEPLIWPVGFLAFAGRCLVATFGVVTESAMQGGRQYLAKSAHNLGLLSYLVYSRTNFSFLILAASFLHKMWWFLIVSAVYGWAFYGASFWWVGRRIRQGEIATTSD